MLIFDSSIKRWKQIGINSFGSKICTKFEAISAYTQVDKYRQFIDSTINSAQESPKQFLAKCAKKYPEYLGQVDGLAFICADGSLICQNTKGGNLLNIKQLSVSRTHENKILEYFIEDQYLNQRHSISFSAINYCE